MALQDTYLEALTAEIAGAVPVHNHAVDTVFLGGGTPSCAKHGTVAWIMNSLRRSFYVQRDAEITIEANPDSITCAKLVEWREAGINRLSIGLQAAQPRHLQSLGRVHTVEQFHAAYRLARQWFDNINVDLIYGLPGQTVAEWHETIRTVAQLRPDHISCYALSVEDDTPLASDIRAGLLCTSDEDVEVRMYDDACRMLTHRGFEQYEISNFALTGRECRHNLRYWTQCDYLGLGAAAHSMIGRFRFANPESVSRYIKMYRTGTAEHEECAFVTDEERADEFLMLRTRLCCGFSREEFRQVCGCAIAGERAAGLEFCMQQGLLEERDGRIRPTHRGLLFQNQVALRLMTF